MRMFVFVVLFLALLVPVAAPPAAALSWEHRVVVPTTMRTDEASVAASLEANVNQLAAHGYEIVAVAGGDAAVLDTLLGRRQAGAGGAERPVALVVMARPAGGRAIAREYRLLHPEESTPLADTLARLAADGFAYRSSELDGPVTHLVFERREGADPVELRAYRNQFRKSWMEQLLADEGVPARLRAVVPVGLGAGFVELGSPQESPGDVRWLSAHDYDFSTLEEKVAPLARSGYGVEMVRRRESNFDLLMVRPAGASGSAARFDLDAGSWGAPCGSGRLAGAAVAADGRVFCAADRGGSAPPANRGYDLTVRPIAKADDALLFRVPTCSVEARLRSRRAPSARLAFALQLEREIARNLEAGHRVTRLLAAADGNGQRRLVLFTSDAAVAQPRGRVANPGPAPALAVLLDTVGDDLTRQREAAINAELASAAGEDGSLWIELPTRRGAPATLLGCVRGSVARDRVADVARGILIRSGQGELRLDDRVISFL